MRMLNYDKFGNLHKLHTEQMEDIEFEARKSAVWLQSYWSSSSSGDGGVRVCDKDLTGFAPFTHSLWWRRSHDRGKLDCAVLSGTC